MKVNGSWLPALAATLALVGATAGTPAAGRSDLAAAYDRFGFALFEKLEAGQPSENVFLSPASVAIALAMAANGAAGTTRGAILATLGAANVPMPAFNDANRALLAALRNPGSGIHFSIANALWLNADLTIEPSFIGVNRDVFAAAAQNLPFGQPQAAQTINDWVKANTDGLIPAIVDQTSPADVTILTNAIAMKAKWQTPFEKSATRDAPFHKAGGGESTVSMMARSGTFEYAQDANWQIARLPYCCANRFAMYVFLPREGLALHDALQTFGASEFARGAAALQAQQVAFSMPRYTATFKTTLNTPLEQLGMGIAFSRGADFSDLLAPPARAAISRVNHRVFVRVDEEGTEAAAATSIGMTMMAMRAPPSIKMIVDRPFLMAIRDDRTRQLLFLGAIVSP